MGGFLLLALGKLVSKISASGALGYCHGLVVKYEYSAAVECIILWLHRIQKMKAGFKQTFYLNSFLDLLIENEVLLKNNETIEDLYTCLSTYSDFGENKDTANKFVDLSRAAFGLKMQVQMTGFAEQASIICPEWGYPQFLLGWYGLFIQELNSLHHFRKAIELDKCMLNI